MPEVVHTTRVMMVHMATLGPENQSHKVRPNTPWPARSPAAPAGALSISAVTSRTAVAELVARLDDIRKMIVEELGDVLYRG